MTLPNTFAGLTAPQMVFLDQNFAAVGALGIVPCTASGTNLITLTPLASTPTISAYANYLNFSFVAVNSTTGPVTLQVGALAALPVYLPDGATQATTNTIQKNFAYVVLFNTALNSGGGGFVIVSSLMGSAFKQATVTTFTSGSGTYTPPSGAVRLFVRIVGGGGGGAGSGTTPGAAGTGGQTSFSSGATSMQANGGTAGSTGASGGSVSGGSAVTFGNNISYTGGNGATPATNTNAIGGGGGASAFGGQGIQAAAATSAGVPPSPNTGSGGSGASCSATTNAGGGGGAGGYAEGLYTFPLLSAYSYAVGTGGIGGSLGTSGAAGAAGAAGIVTIQEYYN